MKKSAALAILWTFPKKQNSIVLIDMKKPTLKEKVAQYEAFLHNINMMTISGNGSGIRTLLNNADSWSYSHRVGNGELSDKQQQELINKAFWNLNNLE